MASYYISHLGSGAGGTSWATAYTTWANAVSGKVAGDIFYIAHDHTQTQASTVTLTSPGTETSPSKFYCVDRAGSVPPVAADLRTTALIEATSTGSVTLGTGSNSEVYGVIFSAGSGTSLGSINVASVASRNWRLVNCHLKLANTSTASSIIVGAASTRTILENCTVEFGATQQGISISGQVTVRGPSTTSFIVGSTIPSSLFQPTGGGSALIEGVDLSAATGGMSRGQQVASTLVFKDCKTASTTTLWGTNNTTGTGGVESYRLRSRHDDTNYVLEKRSYAGNMTTETTIVRTGGASDGTTPVAWKIVTANTLHFFECPPIQIWNETTGSAITLTIEGVWDDAATPLDSRIWIEVSYLGTSGTSMASRVSSEGYSWVPGGGSNLPAGSGGWPAFGTAPKPFKMSVTFTPQEKGPITVYVRPAAELTTYYIDPKPVLT